MLFTFFGDWTGQFDEFGHFEADLLFDNFEQSDVSDAEVSDIANERAAQCAAAGVELADTSRNQVDQNVGVANLLQCFFC